MFNNTKTHAHPDVADHPQGHADYIIATEGDYTEHNYVRNGVLGGFDIELTRALCAHMGKACAIVTVPWAAVFPRDYVQFGWSSNGKVYPGLGFQNRWFHCSVGTRNIITRQQSVAFTDPYTDRSVDKAGFIVAAEAAADFPADAAGRSVALIAGFSTSTYFLSRAGLAFLPRRVVQYTVQTEMWAALTSRKVPSCVLPGGGREGQRRGWGRAGGVAGPGTAGAGRPGKGQGRAGKGRAITVCLCQPFLDTIWVFLGSRFVDRHTHYGAFISTETAGDKFRSGGLPFAL